MDAETRTDPVQGSAVYPLGSRVNERGHLEIGGCDVTELAAEFGTPAYVYAEDDLRARARGYLDAFRAHGDDFEVIYASKAAPVSAIYRLFADEGLAVDVASGGELHMAIRAGCDPARIYVHGNNKTAAELELAIQTGVGHVIVDSFDEIERLDAMLDGAAGRPDPRHPRHQGRHPLVHPDRTARLEVRIRPRRRARRPRDRRGARHAEPQARRASTRTSARRSSSSSRT